jgi:outer membrane protein assembly factor BamD (BamD/ComL family)
MRLSRHILFISGLILMNSAFHQLHAQLGFDLKVDKPKPYEDRVLKAEKSPDKRMKGPRRFFQNLTTHYNYYFNASNKLNEVIEQAKEAFMDDYTTLLPFYNYRLDITAGNKTQLDSVIYKSQTGIVQHDLRNDWIDNMYLLWGAAWYFEKKFDSASLMFQFINYAFAEKEKDGYYRYIGSRMDGNNALSISTKENRNFPRNMVTPPSRNNALIWQVRTLIELGAMAQSGSLIATLKNDPLFPARLKDDLEEVQAYWYYKQNMWDSSATHLVLALDQAKTKQERARWEFLAAQLFERSGQVEEAAKWYAKSIGHTTDPVMDVYARLNLVRINKEGGENYIDKNIAELLKMAKRDKYTDYRDVIYFMAAQMEMERNNFAAAQELLLKGSKYNNGNLRSKNKSYLLIADLSFDQKKYLQAASFYDSIDVKDLEAPVAARVEERKLMLAKVVSYTRTINNQDSLQKIAAMPEEERTAYLTKILKQLRKQQGLDDNTPTSGNPFAGNKPVDLFPTESQKGEWYFYNNTLKTQGASQFKQTWGNRPNVDNWRRFSDVNQQQLSKLPGNTREAEKQARANAPEDNTPSLNSLLNKLPLTPEQMQASNDSLRIAMFELGMTYLNDVQDYPLAIETFEKIRQRFPDAANMNEVLFQLYYAYKKAGNDAEAEKIKKLILSKDPASRFATILTTGKDPEAKSNKSEEINKTYESIYDMFIEGRFDEAIVAKRNADSLYQTNYWKPQLLYIESVYHIRQREDSVAKNMLQTLIAQDPNSLLAKKAQTMIDVLNRRTQIEDELTRLQIQLPAEDSVIKAPVVMAPPPPPVRKDSIITQQKKPVVVNNPRPPVDTTTKKPIVQTRPPALVYRFEPASKHYVLVVMDKVDPLFINEVKNAFGRYNRDKYYNQTFQMNIRDFDADRKLLLIGDFNNAQEAVDYALQAKRLAASEILPWLKPEKYAISIVSDPNLEILSEKKDLTQYKQFLDQNLPGKF